jgi:hypothetical protein
MTFFFESVLNYSLDLPLLLPLSPGLRRNGVTVSVGCPSVLPGLLCFGWKKALHTPKTGGKGISIAQSVWPTVNAGMCFVDYRMGDHVSQWTHFKLPPSLLPFHVAHVLFFLEH